MNGTSNAPTVHDFVIHFLQLALVFKRLVREISKQLRYRSGRRLVSERIILFHRGLFAAQRVA
jgi:hypothetical protein